MVWTCRGRLGRCDDWPMTGLHTIDTKVNFPSRLRGRVRVGATPGLNEAQFGAHRDAGADALVDRTPRGVMRVRSLRGLALVVGAARQGVVHADPLDDEDPVFYLDVTFGSRHQLAAARIDPARLH